MMRLGRILLVLLVAQGLDGVETAGAPGGVEAEEQADGRGERDGYSREGIPAEVSAR